MGNDIGWRVWVFKIVGWLVGWFGYWLVGGTGWDVAWVYGSFFSSSSSL